MSFLNGKVVERMVVPVECCTERGTAFFIDSRKLLTARHVVREHFCTPESSMPVYVIIGGVKVTCRAIEFGENNDVALLTITDEESFSASEWLHLLKDEYVEKLKLKVYGYPQELAMGVNLVEITVRNRLQISDYNDRAVTREDMLNLHCYNGLSGAPVVNMHGRVVGILTQQTNETLGYLSVEKMHAILDKLELEYANDWQNGDNTTFGQGRSAEISEGTIISIHDRYLPNLHQKNERLETTLKYSVDKKTFDEKTKDAAALQDFLNGLNDNLKRKLSSVYRKNNPSLTFPPKNVDEQEIFCKFTMNDKFKSILSWKQNIELNNIVRKLFDGNAFEYIARNNQKNICLVGKAGSGKTHSLCEFARHNQDLANIYLFLGTEFGANKSVIGHLKDKVCEGNEFWDFNLKMKERGRFAVIVIDAINEGLGCAYWNNQLGGLRKELKRYDYFRLIVSVRSPFDKELNDLTAKDSNWTIVPVVGFENKEEAIKSFFEEYEVPMIYKEKNLEAFENPLFLKIFCETFHAMSPSERESASKMAIYKKYVEKKNVLVSNQVDEDLELNIADKYLQKLARYSVNKLHFNTISRNDARKIAKQLCPGRFWSNDLLNACLTSSLLLEDRSSAGGSAVMFEYENLGDYYKAEQIMQCCKNMRQHKKMHVKNDVDELLLWLQDKRQYFNQHPEISSNKFENAIKALFDCWMLKGVKVHQNNIIKNDDNLKELFTGYLMESDRSYDEIFDILCEIDPNIKHDLELVRQPKKLSLVETLEVHNHLKSYETVGKRDLLWTAFVNDMFVNSRTDIIGNLPCENNPSIDIDDEEKIQIVRLGWLLATAHPKYRALLTRKLRRLFKIHPNLITWQLDLFDNVNDPYILQGLYCAVAGVILSTRDKELASSVAGFVYKRYYEKVEMVPQDLIIRQWSLKILEKAYAIDSTCDWWTKIKTHFKPLHYEEKEITPYELINQYFFGMQQGSQLIYHSIFGFSDFNRYIIGTNNRRLSNNYFKYDDTVDAYVGDDLDREKAELAHYIKNVYGWNDKLGSIDNGKFSTSRFQNETERIGKKFQWLAWYRMNARLMDSYKVSKNRYHYGDIANEDELIETPYPWNTYKTSKFDPTIDVYAYKTAKIQVSVIGDMSVIGIKDTKWIDNNNCLPNFRFCAKDKDDQLYIMLYGFDKIKYENKEFAVISNSAFVKKSNATKLKRWCKTQNFYGRWMPERTGSIDFLWNEYPWADNYKSSIEEDDWERPSNDCPCDIMLSYAAQLQENWEGIANEDEYLTTAYMPCQEIMEKMELYCSEIRGIVRLKKNDQIAAVNLSNENGMTGLFIRKDILDDFLSKSNQQLFYYVLGEKVQTNRDKNSEMRELSAAYSYNPIGDLCELQKMRVVEREISAPIKATQEKIEILKKKNIEEGLTTREMIDLTRMQTELMDEDN